MEETKKAVRSRKDNFTNTEILALIEAYGRRRHIIQGRFKSTLSNRDKKEAWDAVTADVNAVSLSRRKPDELKKKWQKLASEARSDLSRRKHPGTGGRPPPKESPYTDMIGDIFGEASALIDGVQGGVDVGDEGIFAYDAETEG